MKNLKKVSLEYLVKNIENFDFKKKEFEDEIARRIRNKAKANLRKFYKNYWDGVEQFNEVLERINHIQKYYTNWCFITLNGKFIGGKMRKFLNPKDRMAMFFDDMEKNKPKQKRQKNVMI